MTSCFGKQFKRCIMHNGLGMKFKEAGICGCNVGLAICFYECFGRMFRRALLG